MFQIWYTFHPFRVRLENRQTLLWKVKRATGERGFKDKASGSDHPLCAVHGLGLDIFCRLRKILRLLNTVFTVCEYMSFGILWQEKGYRSQAETWQVKNVLIKDFDWQVNLDIFVVSMATWTIEYNLKILLFLSLHKIHSLDFPVNLYTA